MTGGIRYRISGVSADIAAVDSYFDRDTYLVTTDATTNQLSLRLDTTSSGNAVLNYYVFPVGDSYPLTETAYAERDVRDARGRTELELLGVGRRSE